MKGLRRSKFDTPVRNTQTDRDRIAADVEAYLAAGNEIHEIPIGQTNLINGVTKNLLTYGQLDR